MPPTKTGQTVEDLTERDKKRLRGDEAAKRIIAEMDEEAARKLAELTGKPQAIYPLHCCLFN